MLAMNIESNACHIFIFIVTNCTINHLVTHAVLM